MATEIKLPELGENLPGGNVLDVKVAEGDNVTEGQSLLEVEAEKSTIDVPASIAGRVAKILVKRGDAIKVGQTIALVDGDGTAPAEAAAAPAQPKERAAEPEPRAAAATPPQEPKANEQQIAARLPESRPPTDGYRAAAPSKPTPPAPKAQPAGQAKLVPAGPATRRLARELGIDLGQVSGSALGGRVTAEDVKAYVRQLAQGTAPVAAGGPVQAPPLPDFSR
ncbi:MAG TPA: biotin/lipoyl-containing protein, partial [Gemmataceae bacterium]|nr:biotin/lipoyl-containing protein [Gemmataceae bacterium]